ncbi:hypothetical protein AM231_08470 [Paenibacillus solani]|uniref:SWIM-type domain-containing protein n=2 Tax=Paenibacillus solani TaxID=1705565 RepID=A0A0M1P4E7_9BACL|nr:hypothetical protein AM231_08470 [Paenibacillus solani]
MSIRKFEEAFQDFIEKCTEDYLIRSANKGLYKRAHKEIDQGIEVVYTFGEQSVEAVLSEGTICVLENTLDRFSCSCPSDNLCKHVLIAILYYQKNNLKKTAGERVSTTESDEDSRQHHGSDAFSFRQHQDSDASSFTPGAPNPHGAESAGNVGGNDGLESVIEPLPARFEWLVQNDLSVLLQPFDSSIIEEARFQLRYDEELEIKEDTLLTVRLVRKQAEVSFTEAPDVGRALCNVKQREGDLLRVEALLRYRAYKGLEEETILAERAAQVKFSIPAIRECRKLIREILRIGIARLPQSYAAQLETMAVAAHSGNLPEIERSLRGILGELNLFWERHVRFSMPMLLDRLTRLLLSLELLAQEQLPVVQQAQLIGKFRSKFYRTSHLHLYGLGAEPWESRSGYRGITYYSYCFDDHHIYTYSDIRPMYYDDNRFSYSSQYTSTSPWLPGLSLRQFSGSEMNFEGMKVNEERRLSAGEGAKLELLPRRAVEEVDFGSLIKQDIDADHRVLCQPSLFSAPSSPLAMIRMSELIGTMYDQRTQSLLISARMEQDRTIELTLPYKAEWATAISKLEQGRFRTGASPFFMLVRVEKDHMEPISFLQGQDVISIKLDL